MNVATPGKRKQVNYSIGNPLHHHSAVVYDLESCWVDPNFLGLDECSSHSIVVPEWWFLNMKEKPFKKAKTAVKSKMHRVPQ
ncbi:hypothetical protein BpHYR1_011428 [Brachionus plicatilis]|uniref:Uncharacterized protein n=1 Tax=Brachionus plicatilis TaxID=10195 RepID=A0A3M7RFI3_BRAPC|nr:hypothetical protein BpHYR1_011428 [Brachionus plicatilis]